MHNGNIEWKVLTRHINQQLEWERCTHDRRRRDGNIWRTDAEKMSADECEGEQAISSGIHCSDAIYPPFFRANSSFPLPPQSVSLCSSSPHITSISDSRCVLKSHFLSHHLSAWPERLVLTVFISPMSEFIWSEDSSQGLAAAAAAAAVARTITRTSAFQAGRNLGERDLISFNLPKSSFYISPQQLQDIFVCRHNPHLLACKKNHPLLSCLMTFAARLRKSFMGAVNSRPWTMALSTDLKVKWLLSLCLERANQAFCCTT